jgi:uncharacterized protein YqeY
MSSIRERIDAAFKQARLDKDLPTKNVIGMLKTDVLKQLKSGKVTEETDALWIQITGAYAKKLKKSIEQFETLGERGAQLLSEAQFELGFCEQFLPKKMDEAATRSLVESIIEENGIADIKQMGRLMGAVMKSHKDDVDAGLVQRIARELLS